MNSKNSPDMDTNTYPQLSKLDDLMGEVNRYMAFILRMADTESPDSAGSPPLARLLEQHLDIACARLKTLEEEWAAAITQVRDARDEAVQQKSALESSRVSKTEASVALKKRLDEVNSYQSQLEKFQLELKSKESQNDRLGELTSQLANTQRVLEMHGVWQENTMECLEALGHDIHKIPNDASRALDDNLTTAAVSVSARIDGFESLIRSAGEAVSTRIDYSESYITGQIRDAQRLIQNHVGGSQSEIKNRINDLESKVETSITGRGIKNHINSRIGISESNILKAVKDPLAGIATKAEAEQATRSIVSDIVKQSVEASESKILKAVKDPLADMATKDEEQDVKLNTWMEGISAGMSRLAIEETAGGIENTIKETQRVVSSHATRDDLKDMCANVASQFQEGTEKLDEEAQGHLKTLDDQAAHRSEKLRQDVKEHVGELDAAARERAGNLFTRLHERLDTFNQKLDHTSNKMDSLTDSVEAIYDLDNNTLVTAIEDLIQTSARDTQDEISSLSADIEETAALHQRLAVAQHDNAELVFEKQKLRIEVDELKTDHESDVRRWEEDKVAIEASHQDVVKKLKEQIETQRAEIREIQAEKDNFQRMVEARQGGKGKSPNINLGKRSRPSLWQEAVHNFTTFLQSFEVRIDNSKTSAGDHRVTLERVMQMLVELCRQDKKAVAIANTLQLIREAEKDRWYCLHQVVVNSLLSPLGESGRCDIHPKCFQAIKPSTADDPLLLVIRNHRNT
ncbi:hypothetical protein F4819DRAFT_506902 [Hypoxylon fuscum]|nr:hypothetical protein F4819DRAFT_506902 [Hypoxylon fuscum]